MVYIVDETAKKALEQAKMNYESVVSVIWLRNMKASEPEMRVYRIIFGKHV